MAFEEETEEADDYSDMPGHLDEDDFAPVGSKD